MKLSWGIIYKSAQKPFTFVDTLEQMAAWVHGITTKNAYESCVEHLREVGFKWSG